MAFETAIVTGGSRGIGKKIAILLSKMGLNVVICSRTKKEIDSTVKEIKEIIERTKNPSDSTATTAVIEDRLLGIKCDVSKVTEVDCLVKSTVEKFKSIHILVNNAGVVYIKKLIDTSEEEWDKTMNINLKGAFLLSKAILPFMIKNRSSGGVIVNVSSGAGKTGFPDISAYCASKFGMIGLTESLAWEIENYNIKVMAICPGEVDTKMQQDVDLDYYTKNKDKMLKPNQVAERVIDMIFNDKKYHNGQSVDIG
ncbi:MAG TPA: SDR family oxidoreductase [Candidatus Nitrosopolaris sp.]|nr:SDR family oxidoreductase [Candidatus Nitrosopolaris sp.]